MHHWESTIMCVCMGGGGECIYGVAIDAPLSLRHNE